MVSEWCRQIEEGCRILTLTLHPDAPMRLARFLEELYRWNERFNLTRVSADQAAETHILDSLTALKVIPPRERALVLDVGTGGGLPGVPLAIVRPSWQFVLMDSTRKKLVAVEEMCRALGLAHVQTVHARAEEAVRTPDLVRRFEVVVARAVAPLDRLADWILPYVRPGGLAIAYKTPSLETELRRAEGRIRRHGCVVEGLVSVTLPFSRIERILVVMRRPNGAEDS